MVSLKPNFSPTPLFFLRFVPCIHVPSSLQTTRYTGMLHDCMSPQISCICSQTRSGNHREKFIGYHHHGPILSLFLSKSFLSSDTWSCNVQTAFQLWCTRFILKGLRSVFFEIKKENIILSKGAMVLPGRYNIFPNNSTD